jgi:hypothetical protein
MDYLANPSRLFQQNSFKLLLLILITFSCNSSESGLYQIDPRTFVENEISLSDIADDITYVPLDNRYPLSLIYPTSINILKNSIYLSARDIGILRFNRDGSSPKVFGKRGRGPGEWYYCMSIAADDLTETIYVMDSNNEIKVYYKSGIFKGTLKLPESADGYNFSGISFYNSKLFASQYINMGRAKYDWIILDTLGNIIKEKLNPIATFESNIGGGGGTFKFEDKISYWNWYNDTILTISPDFDYTGSYSFSLGEGKIPLHNISASGQNFVDIISKIYIPAYIFETKRFLIYTYRYNNQATLALIEKKTKRTYLANLNSKGGGIKNDLDGGLMFSPINYFTEDNREFLVGLVDAFQLRSYTLSEEFKNSTSISTDKKNSFKILSDKIKETDNQILMIVRLKK